MDALQCSRRESSISLLLRSPRIPGHKIWIKVDEPGWIISTGAFAERKATQCLAVGFLQNIFLHLWRLETMSVRGYLVAFSKCTVLLSLRILLLVPAGLPVRSQGDSHSDNKVMDNITVRQGETVFLRWVHTFLPVFFSCCFSNLSKLSAACRNATQVLSFASCPPALKHWGGFQGISAWKTLSWEAILW